ncbi:PIN domain-containing protein [Methylobacter sp.]|uniref:type II toxin-antitoxin system VapC family toxin n=1 Tax=Methylobacter sp. TaxID=2051955 RepID=UPI00122A0452|nr:PIN domain-containing protein [Methylobacter sp.]TAK59772.1 MAG: PIN domain-containing protein [Methylobacter sp.]
MSDGLVLVDTCAWIDFLRYQEGKLGNQVAFLIENNQVAITGVIIAELLQGAKTEKQQQQINLLINSVTSFPTQEFDWVSAGLLLQELRSRGITLPLTDALIAVIAQRFQAKVLTIDKHFHHLAVELHV